MRWKLRKLGHGSLRLSTPRYMFFVLGHNFTNFDYFFRFKMTKQAGLNSPRNNAVWKSDHTVKKRALEGNDVIFIPNFQACDWLVKLKAGRRWKMRNIRIFATRWSFNSTCFNGRSRGNQRLAHGSDGYPILRQWRWKDHIKTMLRRWLLGERLTCVPNIFARDKVFQAKGS